MTIWLQSVQSIKTCCNKGATGVGAAGLVNALLVGAVLVWLTPVAQYLPFNSLAAIVITGVIPVLDFGQLFYLAQVNIECLAHAGCVAVPCTRHTLAHKLGATLIHIAVLHDGIELKS